MKKNNPKLRALCLTLVLALCGGLFSCSPKGGRDNFIRAALLYNAGMGSQTYADTLSQLEQSLTANMEAEAVDVSKGAPDLDGYDLIYLDGFSAPDENLVARLVTFVEKGGCLMVPCGLAERFDPGFLGIKETVRLESAPEELSFPEADADLKGLQELVKDFADLYRGYADYADLARMDYGCGFVTGTAASLAEAEGLSLYGVNSYGKGAVLYVNPLLPNSFSANGLSLEKTAEGQTDFAAATSAANRLFLGEVAAYASKRKYGYSVSRVMGSFTAPSMAWQLYCDDISALTDGYISVFGDLCTENGQVPSYALARSPKSSPGKLETVTYMLSDNGYKSDPDNPGGAHVIEDGAYLILDRAEEEGDEALLSYPHVCDLNADAIPDIVCGSADGQLYIFYGKSVEDGRWTVEPRQSVYSSDGAIICVDGCAAPSLSDFDQDGFLDMISGGADGKIYYYQGGAGFEPGKLMLTVPGGGQTLPVAIDLNGDTLTDLAVGGENGTVSVYYNGGGGIFEPGPVIECPGEAFTAPWGYDYDGDGDVDLVYGTADGYIARLNNDGGVYTPDGFFDIGEVNSDGNNHIKFGDNCVPRFYDLNGDSQTDIVAGSLEQGMEVAVDSPYFPCKQQLEEQISYIKDNEFYLGLDFSAGEYASAEREAEELSLHTAALESYGVDTKDMGADMPVQGDGVNIAQTAGSVAEAGLSWLSVGSSKAENALSCPFFLSGGESKLMVAAATGADSELVGLNAKYGLPVTAAYSPSPAREDDAEAAVKALGRIKKDNGYSFVREDQLMKSAASACNMELAVKNDGGTLRLSAKAGDKDSPLYDKKYQSCVGVRIDLAAATSSKDVTVDADVWRYDSEKRAVYVALNRKVSVSLDPNAPVKDGSTITDEKSGRVLSVNLPADIDLTDNGAKVKFKEGGMMQLTVAGRIERASAGWEADYSDGATTFTRFGEKAELEFSCK